jgi:NadR type nicotinamide-nucleotide adenylyltransferase
MTRDATRGLVLGKFLPPHAGHLRLVRFAEAMVDRVDVVVATSETESIPGALRVPWMKQLCPFATVHHLDEELPAYPDEHPEFWALWRASLLRCLGDAPTHVFASESYGAELADVLGAKFVPMARPGTEGDGPLAISGTELRRDPWNHWEHLPAVVRPHFLRHIHVVGPESVGKSTLCADLAAEFNTVWVPEYARTWLTRRGAPMEEREGRAQPAVSLDDMIEIARGHTASVSSLAQAATRRLFLDTDVLATKLWSSVLLGSVPTEVEGLASEERPDLTLLLDVDVPFVPDSIRYLPEERRSFFQAYESLLQSAGRPYTILRGGWQERFSAARSASLAVPPPEPLL